MQISRNIISHYISFIFFKAYADLKSEASRYFISYFWWILGPVIEVLIFYLVFSILLNRGTEHFIPFLLIGVMTFNWFGTCVMHCANSILNKGNLIKQISVHKAYFPFVIIITDTFKFIISFAIIVIFINIYGIHVNISYIYIPIVLLSQLLFISAIGILTASLTPFFPDLSLLVGYIVRLLFFISGIFYDPQTIPSNYQSVFFINPMATLIDSYRHILIHSNPPSFISLFIILFVSFIVFLASFYILNKYDKYYPRII